MGEYEIDLLEVNRGLVVAPAGCGKTELIARAVRRHSGSKPILVLTHTNAGVAALRHRLDTAGVGRSRYRLATIDGWAMRLISTFPVRAGHDPGIITRQRPDYRAIREAAVGLLKASHISDVLSASYSQVLVDEYQDCSVRQHAIVGYASMVVPVCVVGDPMQSIFDFGDDPLADWERRVLGHFPMVAELDRPWRWINAGTEPLGEWLLEVRRRLVEREGVDLSTAPEQVSRVVLDGTASDHQKLLEAGRVVAPGGGSVLIIGESTSPESQRRFARQTPGAVTVEAVDLRDLVSFARRLDLGAPDALREIAEFAQGVMTSVGATDLVRRVGILEGGRERKSASSVELAALAFKRERTPERVVDLLVEINKEGGVRAHRPDLLRACVRALQMCSSTAAITFADAAVRIREQSRIQGRRLPKRAVGSTLLLKGLEAEVVVILNADSLNARNLYVAMTRGSKRLIVCGRAGVLNPAA